MAADTEDVWQQEEQKEGQPDLELVQLRTQLLRAVMSDTVGRGRDIDRESHRSFELLGLQGRTFIKLNRQAMVNVITANLDLVYNNQITPADLQEFSDDELRELTKKVVEKLRLRRPPSRAAALEILRRNRHHVVAALAGADGAAQHQNSRSLPRPPLSPSARLSSLIDSPSKAITDEQIEALWKTLMEYAVGSAFGSTAEALPELADILHHVRHTISSDYNASSNHPATDGGKE